MWRRDDDNPSRERDECFVATTTAAIIAAISAAGGSAAAAGIGAHAAGKAAKAQADAANHAADVQGQSARETEAFQRQQAENDFLNSEAARKANYDQYMGRRKAAAQLSGSIGFNLPEAQGYVPGIDPHYTTAGSPAPPSANGAPTQPGQPASGGMPQGIDPRFAALYQKYGVTPGARGSGPADWQYYQNDAVKNANGDVGYILGRLENDLRGGGSKAGGSSPMASRSISSYLQPPNVASMPTHAADFKLRSINAFLR